MVLMPNDFRKFLVDIGADMSPHSKESLLDHLAGTMGLLEDWQCPERVCVAGLFHSVYGTESYQAAVLGSDRRDDVRALIGVEAEHLAYVFGALRKPEFYQRVHGEPVGLIDRLTGDELVISPRDIDDLCNMFVANWLEQRPRVAPEYKYHRPEEFKAMLPRLEPRARDALIEAYQFESN